MDIKREALELHRKNRGKIQLCGKVRIKDSNDLSLVYTPGVAEPCKEIRKDDSLVYQYTNKGNMVAIVTDGSSVLGLGNIGSKASMPVMEGKALLFKELANIDAFPICLESQDKEDIIFTVKQISPTFGGINLEDISAPKCFEIEKRLKKELDIPVFHDDQHGTAIVVLAAIINSLKIAKKNLQDVKIVINGSGAAGIGICNLLLVAGARDIIVCDSKGILNPMDSSLASYKKEIARKTNPRGVKGRLRDAIKGVAFDIMVKSMIPQINAIDRVIHQHGAISPGSVGEVKKPWYMHPHQGDNLLVLHGKRFVELYKPEYGKIEKFVVTPDYIEHNGELILEGGGLVVWDTHVFHRVTSGEEGSASVNLATHYEGFDIKTNFNIYDLNIETGEYRVIREGYKDQF